MMLPDIVNPSYTLPTQTVGYGAAAGTVTTTYPVGGANSVWVMCTTTAYVFVGVGDATTSNGMPVAASVPVIMQAPRKGNSWTVSAIRIGGSDGDLYCKPLGN